MRIPSPAGALALTLVFATASAAQQHGAAQAAPAKPAAGEHAPAARAAVSERDALGAKPAVSERNVPAAKPAAAPGDGPSAKPAVEAEPTRGLVEGAVVAPAKPQVAARPAPVPPEHTHGRGAIRPKVAAKGIGPAVKVQEVTATTSASEVAEKIAVALRAAVPRPRPREPRPVARAVAAPPRPRYQVAWTSSRPAIVTWPEAPDRVVVAWPQQQPPAVRLQWESVVPSKK